MATDRDSAAGPLGALEYEFTDELAIQSALTLFEFQCRAVKENIVRQGALHPALPIVIASVTLVVSVVAAAIWAWDFFATPYLIAAACLAELLLLFKAGLYFHAPFARWYIRRQALRMAQRLAPRTIRWTFFEDRLETASAALERSHAWTDLRKVDVLPELWCLHWKSRVQLIVPAGVLSAELQTLIRRKAGAARAPIAVASPSGS